MTNGKGKGGTAPHNFCFGKKSPHVA